MDRVRIGALGAARITPLALVGPARRVEAAELAAVACRDPARAEAFAERWNVGRWHRSYDELLADPDIDAVYNPLPNSHHAEWTIKALEAGKHVLCEKPFTANAEEARQVHAAADHSGLVVMEAFHWRYHPVAQRVVDLVAGGEIGSLLHVDAAMCVPLPMTNDIRFRLDLAGGAQMDVGAYTVHMLRSVTGEEPEVVRARATELRPGVDRRMDAELRFPGGATGRSVCSLLSARLLDLSLHVYGTHGELHVANPVQPHLWHRLTVATGRGRRTERFVRVPTYVCQLRAFATAVLESGPVLTPPTDSVATMTVIDDVYRAAGLEPRRGTLT